MLDFLDIEVKSTKNGVELCPEFLVKKSNDLMIKGGKFYAIWDEENGCWSKDNFRAQTIIDDQLRVLADEYKDKLGFKPKVNYLYKASTGMIDRWIKYCEKQLGDQFDILDQKLTFENTPRVKKDHCSKKLPYRLEAGNTEAWDELVSTLYDTKDKHKIEWSIGSIVSGADLQKFVVFYGSAGTGKSTILNIINDMFDGYCAMFDAKSLGSKNDAFALEPFKDSPLVGIQHDGDLSKIEDNTRLNSLVSHEAMPINEKFKSIYTTKFKTFLFMGTNTPVKITDAKSGLLRRLIDIRPNGNKVPQARYNTLMNEIKFELGAIAFKCLTVFQDNPGYYNKYKAKDMMETTNDFYNFIEDNYYTFKETEYVSLKMAWDLYKNYVDDANVAYPLSKRAFKHELKNYFGRFITDSRENGVRIYNSYADFKDIFENHDEEFVENEVQEEEWIELKEQPSLIDKEYKDCFAQYEVLDETRNIRRPEYKWDNNRKTLKDIDTSKTHYVKIPLQHIVIDFDIPDENGEKSLELNLKEANKFPKTYCEVSKSGKGIHLHYNYSGDVDELDKVYGEHIEIKTLHVGDSALRRRLSLCNDLPIATISSGLPLKKGDKKVLDKEVKFNEAAIITMIKKNLNKEYHSGTKPSIDYIYKILEDAYNNGTTYDVTPLKSAVMQFAANSTNQSEYCIKLVQKMHFKSKNIEEQDNAENNEKAIIFFDIEVLPNLLLICWKFQGPDKKVVRMINPSPEDVEELMKFRLIGFNCRKYDNHIIYARSLGYSIEQCYRISNRIISGDKSAFFSKAYNISYTDIYDYALKKQSLKKWEIELGIDHKEMEIDWDKPIDEATKDKLMDYCDNDVIATEAVFDATKSDFAARVLLAEVAGMTANDTTNSLTQRIIFGKEKHPNLVYTNLATGERTDGKSTPGIINAFPGYEYVNGKNMYRGIDLSRGGYVYRNEGVYVDVMLLDIESMHPHSIIAMNVFGEYTSRYKELLDARLAVKHKAYDEAMAMLDGLLVNALKDEEKTSNLPNALKRPINSVYGLTSASFDNPCRDPRNVNNIVALRGALFMKTLQDEVEAMGYTVVHIKTDSIKIANGDEKIKKFCMDFAEKYGYRFEHEATYDRMCIVNKAVYIAKYSDDVEINGDHAGQWTATGAEFQHPYIFKKLFSGEEIDYNDMKEVKSSKNTIYLDLNERMNDVSSYEKELEKLEKKFKDGKITEDVYNINKEELERIIATGHNYSFVGKVGAFYPVKKGICGGIMVDGLHNALAGTKGYRWKEWSTIKELEAYDQIDMQYYQDICNSAIESIEKYCPYNIFVDEDRTELNYIAIPF